MGVPLRTERAVVRVSLGLGQVSTEFGMALLPPAEESENTMAKSMPIDMRRVIRAAVDAALEDPVPQPRRKRRLSTGRVLLVGAGLMTAGKLAASSRGREMFGALRNRVDDVEDRFRGSDDDLPEDEGEFDEQEELGAEEVDDEFDEGEEPGDWDEEELDEDEPEPELEEDEQPSRKAPTRRGRGRK
jgi:hypothetical protein